MFWIDLEIRPHACHRVLDGMGKKHRIGEIEGHGEGAEQRERGHFVPAFHIREVFPTEGLARGVGDMVYGLAQGERFGQTGVPQESAEGRPTLWPTVCGVLPRAPPESHEGSEDPIAWERRTRASTSATQAHPKKRWSISSGTVGGSGGG